MERPRILISGSDGDRSNYENAICRAGGEPISCYCPAVDLACDGLILCGGEDVDPVRFGQENCGSAGIDPARDAAEFALAGAFVKGQKPILGICRGHQLLNIAFGGTLIQDISAELHAAHTHDAGVGRDKVHAVLAAEGSLLRRLYGSVFAVNSSHHQALAALGVGLRVTAWSESGIVEGFEHERLPIVGVQFHPERMAYERRRTDTVDGSALLEWFVDRCKGEQKCQVTCGK